MACGPPKASLGSTGPKEEPNVPRELPGTTDLSRKCVGPRDQVCLLVAVPLRRRLCCLDQGRADLSEFALEFSQSLQHVLSRRRYLDLFPDFIRGRAYDALRGKRNMSTRSV